MELEQTDIKPPDAPLSPDGFTLAYLMAHEAQCPACGYNVHALTEARCPECGRALVVRVVPVGGGYSVPWIVALVTLGLAAGVGTLVAAVVVREGLHEPPRFRFILLYFMANIPLPPALLLLRRLFVRLPGAIQWTAAFVSIGATCLMLAWFMLEIGH